MARYRIFSSFVSAKQPDGSCPSYFATPDQPAEISVPDTTPPSRTWLPLDEAAQGCFRRFLKMEVPIAPPSSAPTGSAGRASDGGDFEPLTLKEFASSNGGRHKRGR